jgi:hypothetical protein
MPIELIASDSRDPEYDLEVNIARHFRESGVDGVVIA